MPTRWPPGAQCPAQDTKGIGLTVLQTTTTNEETLTLGVTTGAVNSQASNHFHLRNPTQLCIMSMCACVYTHTITYTHTHIYTSIHAYIQTDIHPCMHNVRRVSVYRHESTKAIPQYGFLPHKMVLEHFTGTSQSFCKNFNLNILHSCTNLLWKGVSFKEVQRKVCHVQTSSSILFFQVSLDQQKADEYTCIL